MNTIKTLLKNELDSELKVLSKMEIGTDQYKTTVDGITKLSDRIIEIDKADQDYDLKTLNTKVEEDLKLKELEQNRKDQRTKNILTGVGVIGGFGLTIWGALKSWEFERDGTVSSIFGRMFMNSLNKIKK